MMNSLRERLSHWVWMKWFFSEINPFPPLLGQGSNSPLLVETSYFPL